MKQVHFNGIELLVRQHIYADVRCKEEKGAVLLCDGENVVVRIPQKWVNAADLISDIMEVFWDNGFDTYRTDKSTPTMEEILGREFRYMQGRYGNAYVHVQKYKSLWFTEGCVTIIGYVCYHRESISKEVVTSTIDIIQKKLEKNLPQ